MHVGDTINRAPELAFGSAVGVRKLDGVGDVDMAEVVGALGIGLGGGAHSEVPPEGSELIG